MSNSTPSSSKTLKPSTDLDDQILLFQVGANAVRGRIVRLGRAIDTILNRHPFEDDLSRLVGETAAIVSLMGAGLKFDGKLILQIQGDGPVSMVVADYHTNGDLRATASLPNKKNDPESGMDNNAETAQKNSTVLRQFIGTGHIAMTVDQGSDMERYQGVTPLDGDNLETAIISYFTQSEQIPTAIKLAVGKLSQPDRPDQWRAGGIIVQFVPGEGGTRERGEAINLNDQDQEEWSRAEAFLATTQADELLDPNLSSHDLLYRLFHEDGVRVFEPRPIQANCGCNQEKIIAVLSRYDPESLKDMVEDGIIKVSCDFCRTDYIFDETGTPITEEKPAEQ